MNPWLLLGVVIALVVSSFGGYRYGKHVEAAEAAQRQVKAVNAAIEEHNADTIIDMEAAFEVGAAEAKAKAAANQNRQEFSHALSEKPRPIACVMPDRAFGLLVDAVDSANGNPATGLKLPNPVPLAPEAGKPAGG